MSVHILVMEKDLSRRLTQPRPWQQFYLRTPVIPVNCYIFRMITSFLVTPGMYILQNSEGYHIQINYYLHILLYSELERERTVVVVWECLMTRVNGWYVLVPSVTNLMEMAVLVCVWYYNILHQYQLQSWQQQYQQKTT